MCKWELCELTDYDEHSCSSSAYLCALWLIDDDCDEPANPELFSFWLANIDFWILVGTKFLSFYVIGDSMGSWLVIDGILGTQIFLNDYLRLKRLFPSKLNLFSLIEFSKFLWKAVY